MEAQCVYRQSQFPTLETAYLNEVQGLGPIGPHLVSTHYWGGLGDRRCLPKVCWKMQHTFSSDYATYVQWLPVTPTVNIFYRRKPSGKILKPLTGFIKPTPLSLFRYLFNQLPATPARHLLHTQKHSPLHVICSLPNPPCSALTYTPPFLGLSGYLP